MTLVGLARGDRFNVYAGAGRIRGLRAPQVLRIRIGARLIPLSFPCVLAQRSLHDVQGPLEQFFLDREGWLDP